jgi:hypothetical protein
MKNSTFRKSIIVRRANGVAIASAAILSLSIASVLAVNEDAPGAAGDPYPNMPAIAPSAFASEGIWTFLNPQGPRDWSTRLAGYDVYIWDQCYAMEQSLRINEP